MNDDLPEIADSLYHQFIDDDSIVGFEGLFRKCGIHSGRKKNKLRAMIYDKYGKESLQLIYRQRLAVCAHNKRPAESYIIPLDQREKMVDGIKKSWVNNDSRKEYSRQLMIKYCAPNSHTLEANKCRVDSRRGYKHSHETKCKIRDSLVGRPLSSAHKNALRVRKCRAGSLGLKRSDITRQKLSAITKKQWRDGIHVPSYKSKGQLEVASMCRAMGYTITEEFLIGGRPYDVYVKEKNLLVEFNGTFWHRDPRFYIATNVCQKIWHNDKLKIDMATKKCYSVVTIWQHDWEHTTDKQSFLERIMNGINT